MARQAALRFPGRAIMWAQWHCQRLVAKGRGKEAATLGKQMWQAQGTFSTSSVLYASSVWSSEGSTDP